MHKITLPFFLLTFLSVFAQKEMVRSITKDLCAPHMHGRGYVNNGDGIAADYISKKFDEIGAHPYPGQLDHFQKFYFPVNTFPGKMRLRINGKTLLPGKDYIVKPNSGGYINFFTTIQVVKEDFFDENFINDTYRTISTSRGKFGLAADIDGLTGDSLDHVRQWLNKFMDAGPVIELDNDKFTWSVSQKAKKYPYVYLKKEHYKDARFFLEVDQELIPAYEAKNVIAYAPAKKKTSETIVFTAHYDHLGRMGKDIYFPGANDNASGTALMIALAKHYIENPAKYNVVFIAFAGEEAGLLGSQYYVSNSFFPLSNIRFLLNLDIMGSGEEGITVVNATKHPKEFSRLQKINKKKDLLTQVKSRGPAANSDHHYFSELGVPSFFIYTMGPNKHYHDIEDTYSELSFAETNDLFTLIQMFVKKL